MAEPAVRKSADWTRRRAELGEARRQRTRQQIMLAAARVIALQGVEAVTIDDVIRAAEVARGTFYNHFDSREQLLEILWDYFNRSSPTVLSTLVAASGDPAHRLVGVLRMVLQRALSDPLWGWLCFSAYAGSEPLDETLRSYPMAEIRDGLATGRFAPCDAEVACDLFMGMAAVGLKAVMSGLRGPGYPEKLASFFLGAMGLARDDAWRTANLPSPPPGPDGAAPGN